MDMVARMMTLTLFAHDNLSHAECAWVRCDTRENVRVCASGQVYGLHSELCDVDRAPSLDKKRVTPSQ